MEKEVKKCPHCGNPIHDEEAIRCLFCGESTERMLDFLAEKWGSPVKTILIAVAVLLVITFVVWVIR